jgi:uncharacterized protein (TIGR02246 family)
MSTAANEENNIRTLYLSLLDQWNKRSSGGFAALFQKNGIMIGFDGSQLNGQAEIYSVFEEIFSNFPTAAYISIIKEVRILSAESALLVAVAGMVPQGQDDISPAVNAVHSISVAKEEENWRIALFQNTPAAFHGRPEMSEKLSEDLRRALHISSAN